MNRTLVLASTSRYRAELLGKLGLPFITASPGTDETALHDETPRELVTRLARAKAEAVADRFPHALVIGSDQMAVCGTQVLGKPGSVARAEAQLALLSGHTVEFVTGLCLLDARESSVSVELDVTRVVFRPLTDSEIKHYVAREQPLDCAGAFKSEGLGIALFERIEGEDPNALIGLPLIRLCRLLRAAGVDVLGQSTD
ncbi:MAG: Maf family protein [Pseudomonadales bacterium]